MHQQILDALMIIAIVVIKEGYTDKDLIPIHDLVMNTLIDALNPPA